MSRKDLGSQGTSDACHSLRSLKYAGHEVRESHKSSTNVLTWTSLTEALLSGCSSHLNLIIKKGKR